MDTSSWKIVLIVDNYPCHRQIENLRNTKLLFLPPNTTAFTQPMDAGVIRNFKFYYKLDLVRRRIAAIDNNQEFSINLLQAIYLEDKSWKKVTEERFRIVSSMLDLFKVANLLF